ncbi:MAG: proprotein convertase P-domain-containing protein [Bdellovibrionales bacterium]|nr:proprotein convertase P-domain-containing protein [Bdellovibrionales bacterium]
MIRSIQSPLKVSFLGALAALSLSACQQVDPAGITASTDSKVIYGNDDRIDPIQTADAFWLDRADSTVALIRAAKLSDLGNGTTRIAVVNHGESNSLCSNEPFAEQVEAAFCSGFLVAPNLMVTAGHCIEDAADCSATRFVFGFAVRSGGAQPETVPTRDVYSCAQVLHSQAVGNGADYAVIRLDRAVIGHEPLSIRRTGSLAVGDGLTVIGHPSGLPTKIAGGANVRSLQSGYVVANLDTYGGNSGSAVFNSITGEVEGILVRGEQDYEFQNGCYVSKKCGDSECRGEDVTTINQAIPYIDGTAPLEPTPVEPEPDMPVPSETEIFSGAMGVPAGIPDASTVGVTSQILVPKAPLGRAVLVTVSIQHSYVGDLEITVTSPNGRTVVLREQSYFEGDDNIQGTYGLDLSSVGDLSELASVNVSGIWTLTVKDSMSADTGSLLDWKLTFQGAN